MSVKELFENAGQGHLFADWARLLPAEQLAYTAQLSKINDPAGLVRTVQQAIAFSQQQARALNDRYDLLPALLFASLIDASAAERAEWHGAGLEAIASGSVGVLLMAGGQGTRLGSAKPKGCFDIGLPLHKLLFQIQAEKLLKVTALANAVHGTSAVIPWYVMTLGPTRGDTELFFKEHHYFGIDPANVTFFDQGTLPCFLADGTQILPASAGSINELPDGNGGLYRAIHDHGLVADFEHRGLKHLHMYCVDNVLVKIADPVFLGFAITRGYDVATKVVRKLDPLELVGLIVYDREAKGPKVIEYLEILPELASARDPSDPLLLRLRGANIVNHYYLVELLKTRIPTWILLQQHLPFHIAHKKIPTWDAATQAVVKPELPNGIKLEQFIFDVFPLVEIAKFGLLEVARNEEFAPLKNGAGAKSDTAEHAKQAYLQLGTLWVVAAGGGVDGVVEVKPSTSYEGEGLQVSGQLFANLSTV